MEQMNEEIKASESKLAELNIGSETKTKLYVKMPFETSFWPKIEQILKKNISNPKELEVIWIPSI